MPGTEEEFRTVLEGKQIPILPLDNKWYRLMNELPKTKRMEELEEEIKELLKRQGKLNTLCKEIKKKKSLLLNRMVNKMAEEGAADIQNESKEQIEEFNAQLEEYQDELLDLPKEISQLNFELMLDTMSICYEVLQENTKKIDEIGEWINNIRIELKKNIVKKQESELKNQEMYSYMHDIFGPDVINIFDMKYNPEETHIVKK